MDVDLDINDGPLGCCAFDTRFEARRSEGIEAQHFLIDDLVNSR